MPSSLTISCGGHLLTLLPQRALWWEAQATLFIADPHFGKAATFRALGQPVPAGTTSETLSRLDQLIAAWPARRLVVLGDFFHAKASHAPATLAALGTWRRMHPLLQWVLIRGNHDNRAGDPPANLDIHVVDEPYDVCGLRLRHHPPAVADEALTGGDATYCIAGHVHPVTTVRGRGRDRVRLVCFDMGRQDGVLPAFGAFTGGWEISAQEGRRRFVIAENAVFAL
jgi:DNA ligase-associated metallophosphoesterase